LLHIEGAVKHYPVRPGLLGRSSEVVHAVDGVDLDIAAAETLAIVGESGSGKSTLARLVAMLETPTAGRILFGDRDLAMLGAAERRLMRREIQIVFQDPASALNPGLTIADAVREPLVIHKIGTRTERRERVARLLESVGLGPEHGERYPRQLSGGQLQRAVIARALALEPKLLVLDEPASALDVLVQAEILHLLLELQRSTGISMIFITHDLAVAYQVSTRVAVYAAHHPSTQALLSAAPGSATERIILHGDRPSAVRPPSGCRFRTRCWKAEDICASEVPPLAPVGEGHRAACFFAEPPKIGRTGDKTLAAS
jgi:peptide/nickel transport system ATP-binding protein